VDVVPELSHLVLVLHRKALEHQPCVDQIIYDLAFVLCESIVSGDHVHASDSDLDYYY
jgi:hypothetical protein